MPADVTSTNYKLYEVRWKKSCFITLVLQLGENFAKLNKQAGPSKLALPLPLPEKLS